VITSQTVLVDMLAVGEVSPSRVSHRLGSGTRRDRSAAAVVLVGLRRAGLVRVSRRLTTALPQGRRLLVVRGRVAAYVLTDKGRMNALLLAKVGAAAPKRGDR
jgi:hypothetical protein